MLAELSMRKDVQSIFRATPHEKQVMMFSATLDKEVRPVCRKFCQDVSQENNDRINMVLWVALWCFSAVYSSLIKTKLPLPTVLCVKA
jgi:hypothetical protein